MLRGIYTAASGMIHSQAKQDSAANNIANSGTTGYKQEKIAAKPFPEVMLQNRDNNEDGSSEVRKIGKMSFGVENGEVYTDFNQGILQETGSDLDFAINGKGFFSFQYFDGIKDTIKYSRDGSFKLDSEGKIVTHNGGYVLGRNIETGKTGPIYVGGGSVTVDGSGVLSVDSVPKYKIQVSDFQDYNGIAKEGKNVYAVVDENTQPVEVLPGQYEIRQRQIEQSNIDISSEMVSMVTNLRSFQASQRVISSLDETLGKAVNEIGALR